MTSLAPLQLSRTYDRIDPYLKSEKRGGIVNAGSPGYHTSREDLIKQGRSDNYSIQCPADKRGNPQHSSGIDITFSTLAELIVVHTRLRRACTPDALGVYDPRIECVREIIGTLDGRNVSGYNRVATGTGSRGRVGWVASGFSDSTHLWHEHISILRDRCDDENDMLGLAEVIAGLERGRLGWKGEGAGEVKPPVYLPVYWVDPKKVSTYLWGVRHADGEPVHEREPRFKIDTGVDIIELAGHKWLLTEKGIRYRMDFLTDVKPPPEPVVTKTIIRVMNHNQLQNSDPRGKPWGARAERLATFYKASGATVFLWQEIDPDATDTPQVMDVVKLMNGKDVGRYLYDRGGPNAVGWDTRVWEQAGTPTTKKLKHIDGYGVRTLHVVPLREKSSGKVVHFASGHLNHKTGSTAEGLRKTMAQQIVADLRDERAVKGAIVVLGADFNDAGMTVDEPKGVLKASGFKLLSEQSGVTNRDVESHHGMTKPSKTKKWIDDLCWVGATYRKGSLLDTYAKRLSDHNAELADLEI